MTGNGFCKPAGGENMADPATKGFKVHYRLASLARGEDTTTPPPTFETLLRTVMQGPLGNDYAARMFRISDERADQALINQSELTPPGVFLQLFHLDSRRELPFLRRQSDKAPTANVVSRAVPEDENAMGSAAYVMALGNHVAAIEPFALRVGALQAYFNALFQAAGHLEPAEHWKLAPKVQITGSSAGANRGVTRFAVRPIARLVGEGPSRMPAEVATRPRPTAQAETRMARGGKVVEILEVLGASEADLDSIRASMSADLGLEASVEIRVRQNNRKTQARLETQDISQAIASLEQDNTVSIVSPDGSTKGHLSTLWKAVEIAEIGGLLPLKNVAAALTSALNDWGARGIVDLSGHGP